MARRVKIPIEAIQAEGKRVVRFAERAVQFQSFGCLPFHGNVASFNIGPAKPGRGETVE